MLKVSRLLTANNPQAPKRLTTFRAAAVPAPPVLYHFTSSANRESIKEQGLAQAFGEAQGGIFFTNTFKPQRGFDCWAMSTTGWPFELDNFGQEDMDGEEWFCTYRDVPPTRLKLIPAGHVAFDGSSFCGCGAMKNAGDRVCNECSVDARDETYGPGESTITGKGLATGRMAATGLALIHLDLD